VSIVDKIKAVLGGKAREEMKRDSAPRELWSPEMGEDYRSFWNNMAKDRGGAYLAVAGEPFGRPATEETLSAHGKDTAEIIKKALDIGPEDRVLEVGVGVGRIAEHIAPACRTFIGTDISENMITIASQRLKGLDNAEFFVTLKSDLAVFEDNSFDKAYFQVVLIHLDREDAFHYLRETARVLAPGGRAWFQFYNLLHPGGFKEFRFAVDYMVEKGEKTRGRVHCYTAPEVRRLVEQAGLVIIEDLSHLEMEDQDFGFDVPDTDWEFYLIAVAEKPENG
jgi:ubiquinone/menaquinone biosynthesis C-methylase UbiE